MLFYFENRSTGVDASTVVPSEVERKWHEVVQCLPYVEGLQIHVSALKNAAQNIDHHQIANAEQLNMIYIIR